MPTTYYTALKERHGMSYEYSYDSILNIVEYTSRLKDFKRLSIHTLPVAHARNAISQIFYYKTENQDPNDTLVMLDSDHMMQKDIVERLAAHDKGVVGALAVSRGEIPFVCFFGKGPEGDDNLYNLGEWQDGELIEGVVVGSGAIAIKRWVFKKLEHCAPSWFRYLYGGYEFESTEEMFFGYECAKAGIPHYCDTSLIIPHLSLTAAIPDDWRAYYKEHPEVKRTAKPVTEFENHIVDGQLKQLVKVEKKLDGELVTAEFDAGLKDAKKKVEDTTWKNIAATIKRI